MPQLRILGGSAKGRTLVIPNTARPTPARVRKSLFDLLEVHFGVGSSLLDLYAGSGAVGLEAAARGFVVTMVEKNSAAVETLERNRRTIGVQAKIHKSDALRFLEQKHGFDVVFIDPPYDLDLVELTKKALGSVRLESDGVLISQHPSQISMPEVAGFRLERRVYGSNVLSLYWLEADSDPQGSVVAKRVLSADCDV
ncbi:MAG: RsmD family RNA methyltransferase [Deinococcales bacterium]